MGDTRDDGADLHREQKIVAKNAWHLCRYLIEHDGMPDDVNAGEFLCWAENYPHLEVDEKKAFISQYAKLEHEAGSVTARTLVATRIHGNGFWDAVTKTSVGSYLFLLSLFTLAMAAGLVAVALCGDGSSATGDVGNQTWEKWDYLRVYLAAGLGSCVYLLRVTQDRLKHRDFDPAYIPDHLIRLCLGIIAGGSIVFFPELFDLKNNSGQGTWGTAAAAFIFGYATDLYFILLDRIGGGIRDRKATKPSAKAAAKQASKPKV